MSSDVSSGHRVFRLVLTTSANVHKTLREYTENPRYSHVEVEEMGYSGAAGQMAILLSFIDVEYNSWNQPWDT